MKDDLKAKFFQSLVQSESFQAQQELEDQTYASALSKLLALDLKSPNLASEYALLRGTLDGIKMIQQTRNLLVEKARQHTRENHS